MNDNLLMCSIITGRAKVPKWLVVPKLQFILFSLFVSVFLISTVSAEAMFTITIDETGAAIFSGNASGLSNSTNLPQGITLTNGSISGTTAVLTRKSQDVWTFSFSFPDSQMDVYLPDLAVVKDLNGQLLVDNRQRIRIYSNNSVRVSYTLPADAGILAEKNEKNNVLLVTLIFLALLGSVLFFGRKYLKAQLQQLSKKKRSKPQKDINKKFSLITQLLNDKENHILNILREKGPMKSSYLQRTAEIPKSSFFRNLQELEKKKLIRRFGAGRNKIIELMIK